MMESCDVLVVGAGPAGLTAAIYLTRFRRRVLVLSAGPPRASWIPESHNTPGFPHGVGGVEFLRRLSDQALGFGVEIREVGVETLRATEPGFEAVGGDGHIHSLAVLLATGVRDHLPDLPGLEAAILRSVVRMCPICDAYEAMGQRIAILGDGPLAQREAEFMRTYSDDVTVIASGDGDLTFNEASVRWVARGESEARTFDHLYLALGCEAQTDLAAACGARCDGDGNLIVDTHQMTSVDGLYAAGDVVRGLNQIAVATGEAAIAATAIHNRLRQRARNNHRAPAGE